MQTQLLQINKPAKWGINLLTNMQKLISILLAVLTALFFAALVIIYFVKFISFDDKLQTIIATLMLFLFGGLVMMFVKNIRKPTTITLIVEACCLIYSWVSISFGNHLGELYIDQKDPYTRLTEHAFKAAQPDALGQTLVTGFKLGLPGIIVIVIFYTAQIVIRRYMVVLSNKQLGV